MLGEMNQGQVRLLRQVHMDNELFVGIADNNHFSTAVVGDSRGRIVATGVGESVNFYLCGVSQARENLKRLIADTVGWRKRHNLACVCLTFKTDSIHNDWETFGLVHGFFSDTKVRIEKFSVSCTMGISGELNRIVLVGGHSGFVLFEDGNGLRYSLRHNAPEWDLQARFLKKIRAGRCARACREMQPLLETCPQLPEPARLAFICEFLDQQASRGNPLALEVAHDVAYDLVDLLARVIVCVKGQESVIGLYGPVLLGSEVVYERVRYLIGLLFSQVKLKEAALAPAKGAYLSSLLTNGSRLKHELIGNLVASSQGLQRKRWPGLDWRFRLSC